MPETVLGRVGRRPSLREGLLGPLEDMGQIVGMDVIEHVRAADRRLYIVA